MPRPGDKGLKQQTLYPSDEWVEGVVYVTLQGGEMKTGMGWMKGQLYVHKGITVNEENRWAITHKPCGLLIVHVRIREDAFNIAEWLWANHRSAFSATTEAAAKAMVPTYVREWLRECRKTGGWVDPTPFSEGKELGKERN